MGLLYTLLLHMSTNSFIDNNNYLCHNIPTVNERIIQMIYTQDEIQTANKTSRNSPAIGAKAITPKGVRQFIANRDLDKDTTMILDFGAGKTAAHAETMKADGYAVTAFEFGDNVDPRYHNELALMQTYDIVYASNVLNVQSSERMWRETVDQITRVLNDKGAFIANYPLSPRKADITVKDMAILLKEYFQYVTRVGGTASAPLWLCAK